MNSTGLNVLLDSMHLLPMFGIEVEGLTNDEIVHLRDLALQGPVSHYCLSVVWVEIIGRVMKGLRRAGVETNDA